MRLLVSILLLAALASACATPAPPPACARLRRNLEALAAGGGPNADLQARVLADGVRCQQADLGAFRRLAFDVMDDRRVFRLASEYSGGRACQAEVMLVLATIPHLGAASFGLGDTDGRLSESERAQLTHALRSGD